MTLVHDDLPMEAGAEVQMPEPEVTAWQKTHAPFVTIQVWLGGDGEAMTHVSWEPSVNAADTMCKPLAEMVRAMAAVHNTVHQIEDALEMVAASKAVLEDAPRAS
jgi:hypothetical protein